MTDYIVPSFEQVLERIAEKLQEDMDSLIAELDPDEAREMFNQYLATLPNDDARLVFIRTLDVYHRETPAKRRIHHELERIKIRIEGGRLFGELIDINDIEAMVVAAYYTGCSDAMYTPLSHAEFLETLTHA